MVSVYPPLRFNTIGNIITYFPEKKSCENDKKVVDIIKVGW